MKKAKRRFEAVPLATVPRIGVGPRATAVVEKLVKKEEPYAVQVPGETKNRATEHSE